MWGKARNTLKKYKECRDEFHRGRLSETRHQAECKIELHYCESCFLQSPKRKDGVTFSGWLGQWDTHNIEKTLLSDSEGCGCLFSVKFVGNL